MSSRKNRVWVGGIIGLVVGLMFAVVLPFVEWHDDQADAQFQTAVLQAIRGCHLQEQDCEIEVAAGGVLRSWFQNTRPQSEEALTQVVEAVRNLPYPSQLPDVQLSVMRDRDANENIAALRKLTGLPTGEIFAGVYLLKTTVKSPAHSVIDYDGIPATQMARAYLDPLSTVRTPMPQLRFGWLNLLLLWTIVSSCVVFSYISWDGCRSQETSPAFIDWTLRRKMVGVASTLPGSVIVFIVFAPYILSDKIRSCWRKRRDHLRIVPK
ncbi:MAG: hypothetical protein WC734_01425 [Patescibacteria group bacterium]|jgi:hypothetical protein